MKPTDPQPLGTCDKKQYEHSGSHVKIGDMAQSMPPFPCVNWKPDPQPEALAAPLEELEGIIADLRGQLDRCHAAYMKVTAEPHTLTREQILVKALEVLRDKWPQSHADFRGMTLIELLDYQRSLIAGLMADFVLSLSPSTRPSGEGS